MNTNSWNVLEARGEELWLRQIDSESNGFQFQTNSTSSVINDLRFAVAKSLRTSIIILASFNVVMAFATAVGIFWDCYATARRSDPNIRLRRFSLFKVIGSAETFPFILSLGIIAQGIMFAVVQSKGMQALLMLGCTPISQLVLPAIFIVPYIQLVFGVEKTLQALRRRPFALRRKWIFPTCLLAIIAGLVGTYIFTCFVRAPNFCFSSLFSFVTTWALGCFSLFVGITGTLLIGSVVIFIRLYRDARIGVVERVSASWMVYYMVLGAVSNALATPFFASVAFGQSKGMTKGLDQLAMVASVVTNLSGLTCGVLYIFLRSSHRGRIGPPSQSEQGGRQVKDGIRTLAPSSYIYNKQMELPISPPIVFDRPWTGQTSEGTVIEGGFVIETPKRANVPREQHSPWGPDTATLPTGSVSEEYQAAEALQTQADQNRQTHLRKGSYSIFPSARDTYSTRPSVLLPATTYSPSTKLTAPDEDLLLPPPTIHSPGGPRHHRDSSLISSASVPIGFRVSNVDNMQRINTSYYQMPMAPYFPPSPNYQRRDPSMMIKPLSVVPPAEYRARTDSTAQSINKQLPPIPLSTTHRGENNVQGGDEDFTLSPSVYSPEDEIPRSKIIYPRKSIYGDEDMASSERPRVETAEWI